MRTIKFRAWDKKNKAWRMKGDLENDKYERIAILNSPDFEIMQYTGLHDKNGVEIYEGDILATQPLGSTIPEKRKRILAQVVWEEYGNGYSEKPHGGWRLFAEGDFKHPQVWIHVMGGVEVIGNIYENKELL